MKRTVPFPAMPGRDASKFDASQQLNLGLLHDPTRQGRSLVYDNLDPSYFKRKTACATDYNKPVVERFQEPRDIRNELREERLAMRDAEALEALMDRQQRRYEASMTTQLVPSATSKKSTANTPMFSFPKAARQMGANAPAASGEARAAGGAQKDVSQSYSYLPRVTGAVDFSKGSTREGKQPPPLRAASSLDGNIAHVPLTVRSASVPVDSAMPVESMKDRSMQQGGATLGDFIAPSTATAPLVEMVDTQIPTNPPQTHRTNATRSPDGRSEGEDAPPAFFLSKREQYAIRDLPAPDLKRAAGRTKHISGTSERKQYRYEEVLTDTYNHLDVSSAFKVTQSGASGALPFHKAGREPTQPSQVSKDDPLVKAARRVQDEITETLCPQYRIHLGKLRATRQRDKKRLAEQQQNDTTLPSVFGEPPMPPSPTPKPQRKLRKEPLYTVGHGGGRLSMNLDVLFRGKRFKELLAMHDFMIDRELHGGGSSGGGATTVSWDDDDTLPSRRSNSPAALTITERMEQGLPVSFEEAFAEAERRERLLQLRSLSLMKDNPAAVDPPRTDKRATISFVSAPDRFGAGEKSELHDKAFEGLNHLRVEQHSPATAMIRSHMRLKQLYDTLHDEATPDAASGGRGPSPKKDASMRRLSTLH